MSAEKRRPRSRLRVGKVSVYNHHGAWWLYYREAGQPVRRKVAVDRGAALQIAAQVNAQLATAAPTLLSFEPIAVDELRRRFLDNHELVLKSFLATVRRYRAATAHLVRFAGASARNTQAHQIQPDRFAAYLRTVDVAPNGHPQTARRKLRDKGVQFILETCRAMFAFAGRRRHLPPYSGNPVAQLPLDRLKIQDAKPIFVFDAELPIPPAEVLNSRKVASRPTFTFPISPAPVIAHPKKKLATGNGLTIEPPTVTLEMPAALSIVGP